ncbi:hypothetical protein NM208_g13161 [Fusarium decemcellulare]|uniref:Uncharacterized protein n=1 Tax=Fusarium decemcellulare TaxID=57161 RepID=A0ACC1RM87_9HYPO|nr:hypothetical protein NM208_g13161 [Fusarium decemcellulare]
MTTNSETKTKGKSANANPITRPLRQTRARSKLSNAPPLMNGLDSRGRPVDPLSSDPENIAFNDVLKKLNTRKIILRRSQTPTSPTKKAKTTKRVKFALEKLQTTSTPGPNQVSLVYRVPDQATLALGSASQPSPQSSTSSGSQGGVALGSSSSGSSDTSTNVNTSSSESSSSDSSPSSSSSSSSSYPSSLSSYPNSPSSSDSSDSSEGGASLSGSLVIDPSLVDGLPPYQIIPQGDGHSSVSGASGDATACAPPLVDGILSGSPSVDGFANHVEAQGTRKPRPENIVIPSQVDLAEDRGEIIDKSTMLAQVIPSLISSDGEDTPSTTSQKLRETQYTTSNCSEKSLSKRRRSDDEGGAPPEAKKRRVSEGLFIYSPTYSASTGYPHADISSPAITQIPGLVLLESQTQSVSGSVSPKVLTPYVAPTDFDSEIVGIYGSGQRPRLNYDWYEQYHRLGLDCAKVHGCRHNMLICHECHADWHKAWSRFFKVEEEISLALKALEDLGQCQDETGQDMREGYEGDLIQNEDWQALAPELTPPAGGKVRTHPARMAKHLLALKQAAAAED